MDGSFFVPRVFFLVLGFFFILTHDNSFIWIYLGIPLALIGLTLIAQMISNLFFLIAEEFGVLEIRG